MFDRAAAALSKNRYRILVWNSEKSLFGYENFNMIQNVIAASSIHDEKLKEVQSSLEIEK